ncbi:hypothetical protein LINGRAPRIM_LOCUS1511 [Linum grandiflorum]
MFKMVSSSKLLQIALLLSFLLLFLDSRQGLLFDAKDQASTSTASEQFRVKLGTSRKQYRKASSPGLVGSKRVRKAPSGPNPVGNHSPSTEQ